jgi:hypothetical protein
LGMAFFFLVGLEHLRGALLQDVGVYEHCTIRFVRERQASSIGQRWRIPYIMDSSMSMARPLS